jgi:4,5:9,10-diseco-3-hydroxy-5,9,17-trioxoandrosta-1(10),2-diene-4-oate hydrolase
MVVEERTVEVDSSSVRYLAAGEGPPLVLLHALGESALNWRWVMPALARRRSVYAPDLLGPKSGDGADYSSSSLTGLVANFLDALGIERAVVVGNSLGGLVALRLALSDPSRVEALGLVDSAGLGREIAPALASATLPGYGDAAVYWAKTTMGAAQRAWGKTPLLFALTASAPPEWLAEQHRLGLTPGFMQVTLAALRRHVNPAGQREGEILLDELPRLKVPTLVVWGAGQGLSDTACSGRGIPPPKR